MAYDVNRFRELFFDEAAEHLAAMESGLLALEAGTADADVVHAVFRAAHSIKGVAGSLGFTAITEFTHLIESVLGRFRDGSMAMTPGAVSLIVRATDGMRELISAAAGGEGAVDVADVAAELEAVLAGRSAPTMKPSPTASVGITSPGLRNLEIHFAPHPQFFRTGQDVMLLLRDLTELGTDVHVAVDESRLPPLSDIEPQTSYLSWTIRMSTTASPDDIAGVFLFAEDDCDLVVRTVEPSSVAPAPVTAAADHAKRIELAPPATSIRVTAEKIDALVDLVGEMIIAQAMVNQIGSGIKGVEGRLLNDALSSLHRQTRELQERVMAIRMLPVETVFSRFARLTRDLSSQLGKKVRLETSGSETELDKGMLERLGDPLTHLVRNAIDHGLESADARRAAGKPEEGTVSLRAYHESGGVVIEVADDGRGLDTKRIREKARAQGVIASDRLTDDEIHLLIFEPGFSTATTVTDVSGRGVGMDVVHRSIDSLKGSISVTSRAGVGCTVRLRLPLTLAVLDGLVVRVADQSFVLPITLIAESLRPRGADVHCLAGCGETLELRGESLPFVRLGRVFDVAEAETDPAKGIVVVLDGGGRTFAMLVDDVVGEQQVVIKSLESNFRKVDGAMAATILGDGRVALIVDVPRLAATTARTQNASRPRVSLSA